MARLKPVLFVVLIAALTIGLAGVRPLAQETEKESETETQSQGDDESADDKDAMASEAKEPAAPPLLSFEKGELALLRRLAERRRELEAWEAKLIERERLAAAMEVALSEQAAELKRVRAELAEKQARIDEADKAEEQKDVARIEKLAKAYQAMKPRDAARLFNEMDLELLADIARQIAPRTLAPMMARMDPERARELTEALRKG